MFCVPADVDLRDILLIFRHLDQRTGDVKGILRAHVHYYEDGNVQLQSKKDVVKKAPAVDEESIGKIMKMIGDSEAEYQVRVFFIRAVMARKPSRKTTTPCQTPSSRRCGERYPSPAPRSFCYHTHHSSLAGLVKDCQLSCWKGAFKQIGNERREREKKLVMLSCT